MSAGRERLSLATRERHATVAGVENVATHHAVANTATDDDAVVADVANKATFDEIAHATMNFDGVGTSSFHYQPTERDVGIVGKFEQGLIEGRKECFVGLLNR